MSIEEILASWKNKLIIIKEQQDNSGNIIQKGLRTPQWGAYYEIMSHWSLSKEHAIIVMPTGTGKTDTMITVVVGNLCERVLIIVPSVALRDQIGKKFEQLGILKTFGLLPDNALPPDVGYLKKAFKTLAEIDEFFLKKNVIVSTASVFSNLKQGHLERISSLCSHLFMDEAHHAQAPKTWEKIQTAFAKKCALLFTATPYRNDQKLLLGKNIYTYPLKKAQEEKYFTQIEKVPISEWDDEYADIAIAEKAVEVLRQDLEKYPAHLLMARVNNIARAKDIFSIYEKYSEFNPVLIHSEISKKERKDLLERFTLGKSKLGPSLD